MLVMAAASLSVTTMRSLDRADELALIERARRRDFDAFGRLVDAYQHRVFGFAKRFVKDREEAADITQEVFVRAFQNFERFDARAPLRTWLFRIAYNLCVDKARRLDRQPIEYRIDGNVEGEEPIEVMDDRWNPEAMVLDEELLQRVEDGIATMSEKLRSVLLLHDREDLQYDEIADVLNVPIGTVKSRLFLARAHLKQVLSEYLEAKR